MKDYKLFCQIILFFITFSSYQSEDICNPNPCPFQLECLSLNSSSNNYSCACPAGTSFISNGSTGTCDDMDECSFKPKECGKYTYCENTFGSFQCICKEGFEKYNHLNCIDIDECDEIEDICPDEHQTCVNTPGHFQCQCKKGYIFDATFKTCKVLPMKTKRPIPTKMPEACLLLKCSRNGQCALRNSTYVCGCKPGYFHNNFTCQDIDECKSVSCSNALECKNSPGSFTCECSVGFLFNYTTSTCTDVDECKRCRGTDCKLPNCRGKKCQNTIGSYDCIVDCPDGHHYNETLRKCYDIDECNFNPCSYNGRCQNKIGSYSCLCPKGFYPARDCIDVDECLLSPCPPSALCINLPGLYHCYCLDGFKYVNQSNSCEDIDECVLSDRCHKNYECFNTIGSFQCNCTGVYVNNTCSVNSTFLLLPSDSETLNRILILIFVAVILFVVSAILIKIL